LKGAPVASFTSGHTYVVEFWATWCGPCVVMMPHLGDIQEELGSKGVRVIGFTAQDSTNTEEKVAKLYRAALGRNPSREELALAKAFVGTMPATGDFGPWEQFAQVLLLSNEFAFVD
jgi:thiol-disulfide isomerase/thioredoxin